MHDGQYGLLKGSILPLSQKRFGCLPWPGSNTRYIRGGLLSLDVWFSAQTRRKEQKNIVLKQILERMT